jgi:hypothetical protein
MFYYLFLKAKYEGDLYHTEISEMPVRLPRHI